MKRLALLLGLALTACGGGPAAQKAIVPHDPQSFTLTVTVAGSGSVASSPAGIACPGACSASFVSGTSIVLTETPASGNAFSAWGNGCSGTAATCALSMKADEMPTATFAKNAPPKVASMWRFLICSIDGSQQAYVVDTNLDVNGNSVSEVVYPLSISTGCTFPEANSQTELGPKSVASTIYFGGVLKIAPVGDNFKFTITQGGTTATYSALCVFDPTGGCEGNIDGSTVAFVDGSEYLWNALNPPAGETYTGLLNGVNATITLTQAPNSQTVMGTYQDGVESYSFTGQAFGFSVLVTSQTGGSKIINYFTFDGGPTAQVYFYGFDGSFLGTMQPPGFP